MSMIGANFAGFTRKQVVTSAAFFLYCIANIVTPQTFLGEESPRYHTGLAFVLAYVSLLQGRIIQNADMAIRCLSIYVVLSLTTWVVMRLENNRRDSRAQENPDYVSSAESSSMILGLTDQTDIENKRFRYSGWASCYTACLDSVVIKSQNDMLSEFMAYILTLQFVIYPSQVVKDSAIVSLDTLLSFVQCRSLWLDHYQNYIMYSQTSRFWIQPNSTPISVGLPPFMRAVRLICIQLPYLA